MSPHSIDYSGLILEPIFFVKLHLKPDFELNSEKESVHSSLISFKPYFKVLTK